MAMSGDLPEIVSEEEWLVARKALLAREKELTHARDRLNADRRRLPMVRVEKDYVFEGSAGPASLGDLFEGRPQLVMHHFMFAPDWDDACSSCSSAADQIGNLRQLHVRNTTLVAVSRAPFAKIATYRDRMGWEFPWFSSHGGDFNEDFHATVFDAPASERTDDTGSEEIPGISVFLRVDDEVFHTYSTFGRGIEEFHNGYPWLDLTPLGRQEEWEQPASRAEALGLQVGGPAMRAPDQYEG